jgi:hypothetical protein
MKSPFAVAAFTLLVAGTASAGETGIINQAGPYEAQMHFYLHPALGFPGTPEPAAPTASAVDSRQPATRELNPERRAARASTPAARAWQATHDRSARVAAAGRG